MREKNDNLDSLQHDLSNQLNNKRLLIVLDDMWDDALKENGQCWKRFCAPFRNVQEGSMMLVTTRCPKVTEGVCTMEPLELQGLKDDIIWDFFKLCVFVSDGSNNDPELEHIRERILPKLKGSPLAAKTLGRMLIMDHQASHRNFILESELWELRQDETDILQSLRSSYMHLPFYLKQCFAFCAVYPKDYKFKKACLAEIWVAEGFVEPQGGVPAQDIGCQYFEDLVARSFFQKVSGGYVIHGLLHDMAKMVSKQDCFILRNKSDFDKVPRNVRHLYVLPSSEFDDSDLSRLCKYTKLRTLICEKNLRGGAGSVMDQWCTELFRIRVIACASTNELPDSIGNWKHLRYLEISGACPLKRIPSTFCWLYNLQILYAKQCMLESLPRDFGKLISLQKFELVGLTYCAGRGMCLDPTYGDGQGLRLIKNLNHIRGSLEIASFGMLSKDHAVEAELENKKYLDELKLNMQGASGFREFHIHNNEIEKVLEVLQPPISLKTMFLQNYVGASLPSWFQPQNLPSLKSLTFVCCVGLKSIISPMMSPSINSKEIPTAGIFMSLTNLTIDRCGNITSLEHFLHPDYIPTIKKIRIEQCKMLASVPTEKFGDFHFLEELDVLHCPNIRLQKLVSPSLKKLQLRGSGLFCNIDCCSLTNFDLACMSVMSIQLQMWSVPSLQELTIICGSLTSIGGSTTFTSLNILTVLYCDKLSTLGDLLTQGCLPGIEKIHIKYCPKLMSLPGERFGSFPYLKDLVLVECPSLNWQRGLVLPSSLQRLSLKKCGDISAYIPSCLQNLTSLVSLSIVGCKGLTSIPGNIWRNNLVSLEELEIWDFPDLVSIGGAKAVARIKKVFICGSPNLKQAEQINRRFRLSTRRTG